MYGRFVLVLAATALLALGGSAAALAESPASSLGGSDRGATADRRTAWNVERRAEHRARKCDRLQEKIAKLERAKNHLEQTIARIQEKLASGELTPEQQARARAKLEKLEQRLAHLIQTLERLRTVFAEHCSGGAGDGGKPSADATATNSE